MQLGNGRGMQMIRWLCVFAWMVFLVNSSYAVNLVTIKASTGAKATVSERAAEQFRRFIADFEAAGGRIRFMGGWRPGTCWEGGRHPCGLAIDICQYSRGVVDRRCHYPASTAAIARKHGLLDGRVWRDQDLGHIQLARYIKYETAQAKLPDGAIPFPRSKPQIKVAKIMKKQPSAKVSARDDWW